MVTVLTASLLGVSFLITYFIIPPWIKRAQKANLVGKDINKSDKRKVAELGGLCVICGFLIASLLYVATRVFIYNTFLDKLHFIFAAITSILIAAGIGTIDDILGWKIGLRQRHKLLLTFFIALPLMVVSAGTSIMTIPFLGRVDFGLLYPLLIIPIGIMGASNGFNILAGYNGLESGMGIIILTTLGVFSFINKANYVAFLALAMAAALFAFFLYNKYPAKIFPGDTLTYSTGALIAIIAILGNLEKFAVILFIPYFLELHI